MTRIKWLLLASVTSMALMGGFATAHAHATEKGFSSTVVPWQNQGSLPGPTTAPSIGPIVKPIIKPTLKFIKTQYQKTLGPLVKKYSSKFGSLVKKYSSKYSSKVKEYVEKYVSTTMRAAKGAYLKCQAKAGCKWPSRGLASWVEDKVFRPMENKLINGVIKGGKLKLGAPPCVTLPSVSTALTCVPIR